MPGTLSTELEARSRSSWCSTASRRRAAAQPRGGACSRAISLVDHAAQARRAQLFEAGLEARDVLLDLLDKGEVIGERGQPRVGRDGRRIDRSAAQAAIRAASMRSFLARRRCTLA